MMVPIVAVSGTDGLGQLERSEALIGWALLLGLTGFIFWATLAPPARLRI